MLLLFSFCYQIADLVAVQRLLRQDEEGDQPSVMEGEEELESGDEISEEDVDDEEETAEGGSYEDLLALGRHIGDVKQERWKFR